MDARTCADGVGARERLEMGGEKGRWARMCADSAGATEKLEMGRETGEGPVGMSERGWADVCRWCGEKDRWA